MSTYRHVKDVVSYEQVHLRLKVEVGRPSGFPCIRCGGPAREWAYMGGDPDESRDDIGRPYSFDQSRYSPMCIVCHRRYDRAVSDGRSTDVCPKGHLWSENESPRTKRAPGVGLRFCRACHRENALRWRADHKAERAAYARGYRARKKRESLGLAA